MLLSCNFIQIPFLPSIHPEICVYHRKATKNQTQVFQAIMFILQGVRKRKHRGDIHEMAGIIHVQRTYTLPNIPSSEQEGLGQSALAQEGSGVWMFSGKEFTELLFSP